MDIMLADCEVTSNCSSLSSERARMYRQFSQCPYDEPCLENVRISTTAERKKPLLITKTRVNERNQVKPNAISRNKVFERQRYEARRRFFEDFEQKNLAKKSVVLSTTEATSADNGQNRSTFEQNSAEDSNKKQSVHLVRLFDASNANTKEHFENLNGEAQLNNEVAVHSVEWTNIAQPSFVKRVNVEETNPSSSNIVSIDRTHYYMNSGSSIKTKSSITRGDKSDSTAGTNDKQQRHTSTTIAATATNTEVTLTRSCAETFQCDNSDNEEDLRSPSDLFSNKYHESIDRYECGDDKEASAPHKEAYKDKEMNGKLKSTTELKKQSVRSWIESSMHESTWSNNAEVAEVDPYESYCNDITKIVESIDMNIISSSRTELDALPDTDTCVKYNLDSTNMSLIYSLTPPAAVDQDESNDDTSHDLADRSWQSDSTRSDNDEPLSDYIWIEPTTKVEVVKPTRDRRSSDGSSYAEQLVSEERLSPSGSDILELPSCTIRELKDIDSEIFLNGINESANEIIADLNASDEAPSYDAVEVAREIITEIIESIYVLLHLDSSISDLSVVKEIVRSLIDSYRRECSLMESANRASVTTIGNDGICRIKGFLGNLSSDLDDNQDYEMEIHKTEDHNSSAVIEFCTIAKKLPIIIADHGALELNFRVVSTDEYAKMSPGIHLHLFGKNSIDGDRDKASKTAVIHKSEMETWPGDRYFYCREEEDSIREKLNCLTPIMEEPEDSAREAVDSNSKNPNEEPLHHAEVCNVIDESMAINCAGKSISLDDTYTISEVSSVFISDNEDTNDLEERCDVWDSSMECMSYSYDTKEFIRLEKALADNSRLST